MSLDNPLAGVEVGSSTVGDVDGDGNPDLVITAGWRDSGRTSTLYENRSSQNYQVASVPQPVSGDGTTAGTRAPRSSSPLPRAAPGT